MKCPKCSHPHNLVVDSRKISSSCIRRRRQCNQCKTRWTTRETKFEPAPKDLHTTIIIDNNNLSGRYTAQITQNNKIYKLPHRQMIVNQLGSDFTRISIVFKN